MKYKYMNFNREYVINNGDIVSDIVIVQEPVDVGGIYRMTVEVTVNYGHVLHRMHSHYTLSNARKHLCDILKFARAKGSAIQRII